jgi:hypothetical protein
VSRSSVTACPTNQQQLPTRPRPTPGTTPRACQPSNPTSVAAAELDAESPEGQSVEEQYEERQRAATERLDQIRESMQQHDD